MLALLVPEIPAVTPKMPSLAAKSMPKVLGGMPIKIRGTSRAERRQQLSFLSDQTYPNKVPIGQVRLIIPLRDVCPKLTNNGLATS